MPSVAAALVRGGEVVWSDAVGLADLGKERAATPETQYRIGSITKTFTAAAVFQLRDEGLLDLDDPVGRHVEELTVATPAIRALLSHASGLQREQPGDMWETMVMPSQEELVASLGVAERVIPGSHWHYSNLAFSILGLVVERLRGVPYRQVVNERLLGPVGLARTTWTPVDPVAVPYLVDPFADAVSLEPMLEDGSLGAAGELWSTAVDVARWGAFLGDPDPDVLSPAAAEEMRTVHAMAETDRWTLGWGAGLELVRHGERVWPGHGGAMPGFLAALLFRPQERLSVAVVTNSGARADPDELALALGEKELESRPEPPVGVAPVTAAGGRRPAPRRLVVGGLLVHVLVARRPARGAARRAAGLAPAVGLRARRAGRVADGLGPRARRVAARPARRARRRRPPELGRLPVHARAGAVRAAALGRFKATKQQTVT